MDIIQMTRELAKAIQQDERFVAFNAAKDGSDKDEQLQTMIGEFNLKRMTINQEAQKEVKDEEKLKELNQELRQLYTDIMGNDNMMKFNQTKTELDSLIQRVTTIITLSAEGEDPETCDYEESSCGGSCSSCAGCH